MAKKKSLAWLNCSEAELSQHLQQWLKTETLSNTILLLEGEMGSGKSTFVRALLEIVAPETQSQGSPTFPLVQEYRSSHPHASPVIYHIDLYRLKNEQELADSGIEAQVEEPGTLVCIEWASLFEGFFQYWTNADLKRRKKVWMILIQEGAESQTRSYTIKEI